MKLNFTCGALLTAVALLTAACDQRNWTSGKPKSYTSTTASGPVEHWVFEQAGGPGGEWRWKHIAGNNRIVGSSTESYHNLADCVANAKRNGATDADVPADIRERIGGAPLN